MRPARHGGASTPPSSRGYSTPCPSIHVQAVGARPVTEREKAAFNAGIETMRQMALAAVINLEVRDDARETPPAGCGRCPSGARGRCQGADARGVALFFRCCLQRSALLIWSPRKVRCEIVSSYTMTTRGKSFEQGQSGNPAGRPKGSRNRSTMALEAILEGEGAYSGEGDGLFRPMVIIGSGDCDGRRRT